MKNSKYALAVLVMFVVLTLAIGSAFAAKKAGVNNTHPTLDPHYEAGCVFNGVAGPSSPPVGSDVLCLEVPGTGL